MSFLSKPGDKNLTITFSLRAILKLYAVCWGI